MAKTPPSPDAIAACIAHFEDIAPKIPQQSAFGDDNRERIDMQIRVFRDFDKWLDFEDAAGELDLDFDDDYDLYCAAEDAYNWAWGQDEDDDLAGPFPESWDCLAGIDKASS